MTPNPQLAVGRIYVFLYEFKTEFSVNSELLSVGSRFELFSTRFRGHHDEHLGSGGTVSLFFAVFNNFTFILCCLVLSLINDIFKISIFSCVLLAEFTQPKRFSKLLCKHSNLWKKNEI